MAIIMKTRLFFILFIVVLGLSGYAQKHPDKETVMRILNGDKFESKKGCLHFDKHNTSRIEIVRDGNASKNGYGFTTTIQEGYVTRHAGNGFVVGLVDTYDEENAQAFPAALEAINDTQLRVVSYLQPKQDRQGCTKLNFYKDGELWLTLIDSPDCLNVQGTFMKLVDLLVAITGGEPVYGDTIVPYSDVDHYDSE